jgi:hypothetical protein
MYVYKYMYIDTYIYIYVCACVMCACVMCLPEGANVCCKTLPAAGALRCRVHNGAAAETKQLGHLFPPSRTRVSAQEPHGVDNLTTQQLSATTSPRRRCGERGQLPTGNTRYAAHNTATPPQVSYGTHTHPYTHTRTHAHAHTHTHTQSRRASTSHSSAQKTASP